MNKLDFILLGGVIGLIVFAGFFFFYNDNVQITGLSLLGNSTNEFSNDFITASSDRYVNPSDSRILVKEDLPVQLETTIYTGDINDLLPLENENIASVGWNKLMGFPSGCAVGKAVTNIGGTLTCSTFLKNGDNVSALINDSGFITSFSDTNFETAGYGDLNMDLNYLQTGNNVSDLVNDAGYITDIITDTNFETAGYGDLNMDLNYLQTGNNVSDLVNDSGFITSFSDSNCEVTNSCANIVYWVDANVTFVNQVDGNDWYVLKNDFNTLGDQRYYLDTNPDGFISSSELANYLLETDANNLYVFKEDVNSWGDVRYYPLGTNPAGYITSFSDTNFETAGYSFADYLLVADYLDSNFETAGYSFADYLLVADYLDSNFETAGYGDLNMDLNYLQTGNNVSDLVNDAGYITDIITDTNFETAGYGDLNMDLNYLQSGGNISLLSNDSNFQTYNNIFDLGLALIGANISSFVNDLNFQTYGNVLNLLNPYALIGASLSSFVNDLNFQTYADVLSLLGNYILVGGNISQLNNDSGFITSFSDTNFETAGYGDLNNDLNYLKLTGGTIDGSITGLTDLNTTNLNATTVNATGDIHTDQNFTIGTNGYIMIDGNTMIIGIN